MVTNILANIMAIGHFSTPAGAHVGAAVETKQDGEDQEKRQGFRVHALSGAQGVRGDAPVAALYERRNIFRSGLGGHRPPLQKISNAVEGVEINAVRTAAQQLLRH